jgi:hypothetical protein
MSGSEVGKEFIIWPYCEEQREQCPNSCFGGTDNSSRIIRERTKVRGKKYA